MKNLSEKFTSLVKGKTIASTIIKGTSLFVFGIIIILSVTCLVFQYQTTIHIMKDFLTTEAQTAADRISWVVKAYKNIAEGMGTIPELSSKEIKKNIKEVLLKNKSIEYGLSHCKTINLDGYSDMDDKYRGDRDYFQMASSGKIVISDPLVSRSNDQLVMIVAAPVWRAGIYKGTIDSVVFFALKPQVFNDIMGNLKISKNSDAYIIGYDGTTIAATDNELVLNRNNNILNAETDSRYKTAADIEMKILGGDYSTRFVRRGLGLHCYASCPIAGTPDWTVVIETPVSDYLQGFYVGILFIAILAIAAIFVSTKKTLALSRKISVPVEKMAERLKKAAIGDFSSEVDFDDSLEEVKTISEATQILVNRMDIVINGNESFKSGTRLNELLNLNSLEILIEKIEWNMHISISVLDNHAKVLLGKGEEDSLRKFQSPIVVNDQKFGFILSVADKNCLWLDDDIDCFTECLAILAGKVAESTLQKVGRFESWRENLEFNTKTLVTRIENTSTALSDWISALESGKTGKQEVAKLRDLILKVDESTEYARFSDFDSRVIESDYTINELLLEMKKKLEAESIEKENFAFDMTEDIVPQYFGDAKAIARIAIRLAVVMSIQNNNSPVRIQLSNSDITFGSLLNIKICVLKRTMSDEEIGRLGILTKQTELKIEKLSNMEQKLIGALRMSKKMNCTFDIEIKDSSFGISFSIPQLPIRG